MDGLAEGDLSLPKLSEGPQIPFYRAPSTSPAPTPLRTFSEEQSPIPQLSILLKLFFRNYLVLFRNYSSETILGSSGTILRSSGTILRSSETISRSSETISRSSDFAIF